MIDQRAARSVPATSPRLRYATPSRHRAAAIVAGICALFVFPMLAAAQPAAKQARLVSLPSPDDAPRTSAVPGCPNQSGILDSVTVPVDASIQLAVVVGAPAPPGGAHFDVSSADASVAAAGNRVQGFIPRVTIPEGGTVSNPFTIFGVAVGQTSLHLDPVTPGYSPGAFPLGAWDINRSGSGRDRKFVDANAPSRTCRLPDSPGLSTDPATRATCGVSTRGVSADGVSALLLRSVSGLQGTACFEVVSPGDDNGQVLTPLTTTTQVGQEHYGFSYFLPPSSIGVAEDRRTVTVEFTFTPSIGNGNTTRLAFDLEIVRPPVVLIHGLWSDSRSWRRSYLRNTATHTTVLADYAGSAAASFSANDGVLEPRVAEAVDGVRRKGYAATQADVLAHSMGGILTRRFAASGTYLRPNNFAQGDIRRLITLNTPHWGSSFANLLVSLHAVDANTATKVESTVMDLTHGDMRLGAVCDLAENSPALAQLAGGTNLTSRVVSSTGGPTGSPEAPAPYWGGATWFGINSFERALTETYCSEWIYAHPGRICVETQHFFPQDRVDAFRFREPNDAIVALSSQQGGLALATNFPSLIHFKLPTSSSGITDNETVTSHVHALLDGAESNFAASLPGAQADGSGTARSVPGMPSDSADYASRCTTGGALKPSAVGPSPKGVPRSLPSAASVDPRIQIIEPADGSIVGANTPFLVRIELAPDLTGEYTVGVSLAGLGRIEVDWVEGQLYEVLVPPLPPITGPLNLTPDVTDVDGNFSVGPTIVVGVPPASAPVSLSLLQDVFLLRPDSLPRQLYVNGVLADESEVDLRSHLLGTTYETSDEAVVTVDIDGLVTVIGEGQAHVTASYAGLSAIATFVVEDPENPLPLTDLTDQFHFVRSGLRLNRISGFYVQQVTVTHVGNAPNLGPFYMLLDDLPAEVSLVSKSGSTEQAEPLNRPYVAIPPGANGLTLAPGATRTFVFEFLNPSRAEITYSLAVVSGSESP